MPPKLPTERPPIYTPAPKVAWILSAKRAELQYEIQLINKAAIKNGANKAPYNKQGQINDLREKLAWHHSLNLHPNGAGEGGDVDDNDDDPDFKSVDEVVAGQIIDAQWEGLMALGEEWKRCEESGEKFVLWNEGMFVCRPCMCHQHTHTDLPYGFGAQRQNGRSPSTIPSQ